MTTEEGANYNEVIQKTVYKHYGKIKANLPHIQKHDLENEIYHVLYETQPDNNRLAFRIADRAAIQYFRSNGYYSKQNPTRLKQQCQYRENIISLDYEIDNEKSDSQAISNFINSGEVDPSFHIEIKEVINKIYNQLSDKHKFVWDRIDRGWTVKEISKAAGTSPTSIVHRRQKIKKLFLSEVKDIITS